MENWFYVYSGGYGGGGGGGRSASGIGSGGGGGGGGGSGGGGKPGMTGEYGDFGHWGGSADEKGGKKSGTNDGGNGGDGGTSGAEGRPTDVVLVSSLAKCGYEPLKRRMKICDGETVLVEVDAALGYSLPDLSDALTQINERAPSGQAMQGAFFGTECWYGSDARPRVPSYDRIEDVALQVRWVSKSVLDHQAELPTVSNYVWDGTEKTGVVKMGAGSLFASGTLKATDVGNYSVNLKLDRDSGVNAWADGTRTDPRSFSWSITKPPLAGNVVFTGGELARGQSLDDVRVDSAPDGSAQEIVSTRRLSSGRHLVTIRVTNPNYDGAVEVSAEFTVPETVAFRQWNGSYMEATERGDVIMVTRDMTTLESGWFVVFNDVTFSAGLRVSGDVHLVLTDGATLTVTGGVDVVSGGSLSVYGQDYGLGSLRAIGVSGHDGIGACAGGDCGPVTVQGGIVMAVGGENAAGMGSELTVYGGSVLARGSARPAFARTCRIDASYPAALLEGADEESLLIVTELSGSASCVNIVPGARITVPQKMAVFETCVISNEWQILPGVTIDSGDTVYTVPLGSDVCLDFQLASGFRLADDSTPICGWLFVCEDVVFGSRDYPIPTPAILPVGVPYLAWVDNAWVTNVVEDVTFLSSGEKVTLGNAWYAVRGEVAVMDRIEVTGDAHLVLCDGAKLTASAGIEVGEGHALTIYGQAEGTGALEARGRDWEAGIGGGYHGANGTVTVHGGTIRVVGGRNSAGIGGGSTGAGGTVVVYGGRIAVSGGLRNDLTTRIPAFGPGANGAQGVVTIYGGVFSDDVLTDRAWLADGFAKVKNSDPETLAHYPWRVGMSVSPGVPLVFATVEEAMNAVKVAVFEPTAEVAAVLGAADDGASDAYRQKFGIVIKPTAGNLYAVEAELKPEAWSNLVESVQAATRQIPVADIAALPLDTPVSVTVNGCVPGFYYTIYGGSTVTNLKALPSGEGRNVLCGADGEVTFQEVVKPSSAAGFFSIGARESPTASLAGEDRAITLRP